MLGFAATLSPSAYWYLARGTGAVALVLLTASVVIGIVGTVRIAAPSWPRFAIDAVHRDISLLVLVVLAIHIVTSVLDGFAPIALLDGVIPLVTPYRPVWMGLGTLACDVLLAVMVTSAIRARLGFRAWRAVHLTAYVAWVLGTVHGLGIGTDTSYRPARVVYLGCAGLVVAAVLWRALSPRLRPGPVREVVR